MRGWKKSRPQRALLYVRPMNEGKIKPNRFKKDEVKTVAEGVDTKADFFRAMAETLAGALKVLPLKSSLETISFKLTILML